MYLFLSISMSTCLWIYLYDFTCAWFYLYTSVRYEISCVFVCVYESSVCMCRMPACTDISVHEAVNLLMCGGHSSGQPAAVFSHCETGAHARLSEEGLSRKHCSLYGRTLRPELLERHACMCTRTHARTCTRAHTYACTHTHTKTLSHRQTQMPEHKHAHMPKHTDTERHTHKYT